MENTCLSNIVKSKRIKLFCILCSLSLITFSSCSLNNSQPLNKNSDTETLTQVENEEAVNGVYHISAKKYYSVFQLNEAISYSNTEIVASLETGETKDVTSECSFSPASGTILNKVGQNKISVTHTPSGKTCEYLIEVTDSTPDHFDVVDFETSYSYGEPIDYSNTKVYLVYKNGMTRDISSDVIYTIPSGQTYDDDGVYSGSIIYGSQSIYDFSIKVSAYSYKRIYFYNPEDTMFVGDSFGSSHSCVYALGKDLKPTLLIGNLNYYANGVLIDYIHFPEGYIPSNPGNLEITVEHIPTGLKDSCTIKVIPENSCYVKYDTYRSSYKVGDTFSSMGTTLRVPTYTYVDDYGSFETDEVYSDKLSFSLSDSYVFTENDIGKKEISVYYDSPTLGRLTTTYNIYIANDDPVPFTTDLHLNYPNSGVDFKYDIRKCDSKFEFALWALNNGYSEAASFKIAVFSVDTNALIGVCVANVAGGSRNSPYDGTFIDFETFFFNTTKMYIKAYVEERCYYI